MRDLPRLTPFVCFLAGFGSVGGFFLLLSVPGQNIHGGTLTGVSILFGLLAPLLWFVVGLVMAVRNTGNVRRLAVVLNLTGLLLGVFWLTGRL